MFDNKALIGSSAAGDYEIERSVRFNSGDSAAMSITPASDGNRKKWTFSAWIKKSKVLLSSGECIWTAKQNGSYNDVISIEADEKISFKQELNNTIKQSYSTRLIRDSTGWFHLVVAQDTTQATAANRIKMWFNGVQETLTGNFPNQDSEGNFNRDIKHFLGAVKNTANSNPGSEFNGYMAEVHWIDGTAYEPTDFAKTHNITGAWVPKKASGLTYGTNGFYLNFNDNSDVTAATLGKDQEGTNSLTPTGMSVTTGSDDDSVIDTPTNNYCTLNNLHSNSTGVTFSDGNLKAVVPSSSTTGKAFGNIGVSSGKWYWEIDYISGTSNFLEVGVTTVKWAAGSYRGIRGNDGEKTANTDTDASFATGDLVQVAVDVDNGKWYIGKNGSWMLSGDPVNGTGFVHDDLTSVRASHGNELFPSFYSVTGSGGQTFAVNFGQQEFVHTPPTGFKALCTENFDAPTVKNPGEYFNTVLFTGNGSAGHAITGVGFSPDMVWLKNRGSGHHGIWDTVRGTTKRIVPNSTGAEGTVSGVTAFGSDGFTLGTDINVNNDNYVSWNWRGSDSAAVANTDGSIDSTVSANTDSGFSVVKWTGSGAAATIGHGLNATPAFIWIKNTADTASNLVRHHEIAVNSTTLIENSSAGISTDYWNTSSETRNSTVFSVSSNNEANGNNDAMIAFCWAEVEGFSKMGVWTGNASTDGPFMWCGFKPAFLLHKRSSDSGPWHIFDNKRNTYNPTTITLYPDSDAAEYTNTGSDPQIDFLANGFKVRSSYAQFNGSGDTLIWMAFAKTPFKYSKAY